VAERLARPVVIPVIPPADGSESRLTDISGSPVSGCLVVAYSRLTSSGVRTASSLRPLGPTDSAPVPFSHRFYRSKKPSQFVTKDTFLQWPVTPCSKVVLRVFLTSRETWRTPQACSFGLGSLGF